MAIIVGTGCNATIPMSLSDLHESKAKLVSSRDSKATQTVVNTEITISGAAAPLKELNIETKWDIQLDRACSRPGFQPFEYMTGGRYIGELVRIVFFDYLTNVLGVLKKELPANLVQEYALSTTYLSHKVARSRSDQELAAELARSLPPPESSEWTWNKDTAGAFRKIARAVQTRSAGLIASAVVGLLACTREIQLRDDSARNSPQPPLPEDKTPSQSTTSTNQEQIPAAITSAVAAAAKSLSSSGTSNQRGLIVPVLAPAPADWQSGPEELVVAYTGGIIQNYPNFKETCQRYIDRMIMRTGPQKSGKSVFLREASDGGVIGAGVLAGMVAGLS
jgi:hexokinase